VDQSDLVSCHYPGPAISFSFSSMENIFRFLRLSSCGPLSLKRGRVSNLLVQVLMGIAHAVILRPKYGRTRNHILLSHLGPGSLFVASYDWRSCSGGNLFRLHTGVKSNVKVKAILQPTVSRSVYPRVRPPSLGSCGYLIMRCPL
jgi:hypothetical protein